MSGCLRVCLPKVSEVLFVFVLCELDAGQEASPPLNMHFKLIFELHEQAP